MLSFIEWTDSLNEFGQEGNAGRLLNDLRYLNNMVANPQLTFDFTQYSNKIRQLAELIRNPDAAMWIRTLMGDYQTIADAIARYPKAQNGRKPSPEDDAEFRQRIQQPYQSYKMALEQLSRYV